MFGKKFGLGPLVVAGACLATMADTPGTALAQQGSAPTNARAKRVRAKKSVAKSKPRPKELYFPRLSVLSCRECE
jgi:hypothetical protein